MLLSSSRHFTTFYTNYTNIVKIFFTFTDFVTIMKKNLRIS
nr:MAG TPA: hypothetical protein [Caudoviricetes sp.]